jgi:hypothetical protein
MAEALFSAASSAFPESFIRSLLNTLASETHGAEPVEIVVHDQHSNDVAEIRFDDRRTLMVKRGRFPWAATRFRTARAGARLLHGQARLVAPEPLDVSEAVSDGPLEVYWRIPLPTLKEVWPLLPDGARPAVLRSWGEVARRCHEVRMAGYGPLGGGQSGGPELAGFLETELRERLGPAVTAEWPDGLDVVGTLLEALPLVDARVRGGHSVLIHNDLHMENILCRWRGDEVSCVGVLDLEAAFAGPREAELAHTQVLHSELFFNPLPGRWFDQLCEGYAEPLDPVLMVFFRAYHMVNLGFYSALLGHVEHARAVAVAARAEIAGLAAARHDGAIHAAPVAACAV